jgi:uncharacterized membrane protein YbaN (DUF454 family)
VAGPLGRRLWLALGWLSVGGAAAGTVLPLVPTTPLLLLAAFAFARSSPRLRTMLLEHPHFGPILADWQRHGAIRPRAKLLAVTAMALALLFTFLIGAPHWVAIVQLVLMLPVTLFILSRPSGPARGTEPGTRARRGPKAD